MVKRALLVLCLWCVAASAFALVPKTGTWRATNWPPSTADATSCDAAAQVSASFMSSSAYQNPVLRTYTAVGPANYYSDGSGCAYPATEKLNSSGAVINFNLGINKITSGSCPAGSSPSGSLCACNSGYTESAGQCVQQNLCAALIGKASVVNWTEGYTRTPDEGDTQGVGPVNVIPNTVCSAGCNVSVQKTGPGVEYYVSQQPTSQGLYRRSRDMPSVNLGTQCTSGPNDANQPTAPEPQCPGQVGVVGNKVTCIATAEKPITPTPVPTPEKAPIAGNPSAGPKPPSGDGSGEGSAGRTPSAGTGGNSGGGAAAGMGGKGGGAGGTAAGTGSGTGAGSSNSGGRVTNPGDGTEQAACGAPGQPVCSVKVDETGMPGLGTTFKAATDKVNENFDSTSEAIKQIRDGESKPSWSFTFRLPTGCTSYAPAGFDDFAVTINPCAWQSTIHDLMSMVWAAATAFCLIGMVGRTFRST